MIRGARPIDRISRRGLITSGVLAGVFAASGVPLQARTRGGVLRLGLSAGPETDGLDPRGFRSAFMRVMGQGAVFDCLTEIAATGELTGELAESWESDAQARVWTITLRQGVTFHDGVPLTAEDVLASFAWHQSGFSLAAPIIGQIAEMRSPGPGQVQFILSAGNADFPILLSDPCLIIAPSGRMTEGVGTGLYRIESFEAGAGARLVRVASHYKDGQAGWFEAVELRAIHDPASRVQALLDGSVDAIDGVPPSLADQILAARDLRITRVQGNARLILSLPEPHAADPALARALQASVDRPTLIKEHLSGIGEPAQDHPIGLSNPFIAVLPDASFDPELCQWLSRRTGLALDRGTEGLVAQISAGRLTEDWAFSAAIGSGGHWSGSLGHDRAFGQLLAEARSTFDSARRAAIYAELQALSAARGGVTVAAHVPWLDAHHARLRHADDLGSSLALDSGRIAERWWFA